MARRFLTPRLLFSVRFQSRTAEKVTIHGQGVPEAVYEFDNVGFPEKITEKLKQKYEKPSVIQAISWPVALSGRDLISVAKTGSGKTLAFMLPGIIHTLKVSRRPPGAGPTALVLAPTRELAQQVHNVTLEYGPMMQRNSTCLFGGVPRSNQEIILRQGIDICVATPGRLLDFLAAGVTSLSHCSYLVLDEADRMLDMGFEPQIRDIVAQIKAEQRQTLMFSATWPEEVRQLAADFHSNPVFLNVGSLELAANHNIEQIVEVMDEMQKPERLAKLLSGMLKEKDAKILVFAETRSKCDGLARAILRNGWRAASIHGDKSQLQRDTALRDFRTGRIPILIATDVAARGLDVNDIKCVINYDFPNTTENYVHRIGRTGRQDKNGVAYTFFTPQDAMKAGDLIKVLKEANQTVPPELPPMLSAMGGFKGNLPTGSMRSWGKASNGFGQENRSYGNFGSNRQSNNYGNNRGRSQNYGRW